MNKLAKAFFCISSLVFALLALASPAQAALTYGNGVYTNLCGTTTAATATCNKGCNPTTGTCSASHVVKWTCNGKSIECRENESAWSASQSLAGTACGKTVQLDVFDHNCRDGGPATWSCPGNTNLLDYMVWYSGDCQTATEHKSSCDELRVVSGGNSLVPATVTLRARGSDNKGSIGAYRFYFGDGKQEETTNSEISHKYESSGTFRARVDIKDSKGTWKTSAQCETNVAVLSLPVESHKSDCSDLFIKEGNYTQAPTTAKFSVSGFDNKGGIKRYKMDFGQGVTKESDAGAFEQSYDQAGTYTVKGYVQDSQGNWKGGSGNCQKSLYINTKTLESQPKTGTPTILTLIGIGSGAAGAYLLKTGYGATKSTKKRRSKRS